MRVTTRSTGKDPVPWWYAKGGPPNYRLGRFQVYYPFPVAWAIRAKDWLYRYTLQAALIWLYELAIIDAPETTDVAHWWDVIPSFTLRGNSIYLRQRARQRVDLVEQRGYRRGYEDGVKSVDDRIKAEIDAISTRKAVEWYEREYKLGECDG